MARLDFTFPSDDLAKLLANDDERQNNRTHTIGRYFEQHGAAKAEEYAKATE